MVENRGSKLLLSVLTTGGILLLAGCGNVGQSPLAPGQDKTPVRAAKPTRNSGTTATATSTSASGLPLCTQSASGWFYPGQAGSLNVKFANNYGSWSDVRLKTATFSVAPGSIAAKTQITMDVTSGYTIDDVNVKFGPSGLTFNPEATLTLTFWGGSPVTAEELRLREAQGYHITSDGYISTATTQIDIQGNAYLVVTIKIPGFSRYSLGGNDFAPETQPF